MSLFSAMMLDLVENSTLHTFEDDEGALHYQALVLEAQPLPGADALPTSTV